MLLKAYTKIFLEKTVKDNMETKNKEMLCVPLRQLKGINVDDATKQALGDWAYWVSLKYRFLRHLLAIKTT